MRRASAVALLWFLTLPLALKAQTTTYVAPTGAVSPSLAITMNLTGGGTAVLDPVVGPNCYLGMTCGFPSGYVGTSMSYKLPDGSTASLPNFSGTFSSLGANNYQVSGRASGTDSLGRNVSVDAVEVTMHITCRSGRGGGCSKSYTGGSLTLALNGTAPTSTPTPTAVSTPTATPTPVPCSGDCDGDGQVTVNDLLVLVNIALGNVDVSACIAEEPEGQVTIDQVLTAVNSALQGCQ